MSDFSRMMEYALASNPGVPVTAILGQTPTETNPLPAASAEPMHPAPAATSRETAETRRK